MRVGLIVFILIWHAAVLADFDHDDIKHLRETGVIVSLETIYNLAQTHYSGGRILETELEEREGRYIYEVEILIPTGEVRELYYNAQNGELLFYEIYLPDEKTGVLRGIEIDARTGERWPSTDD